MFGLSARIFRFVGGVLLGQAAWFRRRQPPQENAARPQNNKISQGKIPVSGAKKFSKKFRANFVQTVDKQKKIWYYFYCF